MTTQPKLRFFSADQIRAKGSSAQPRSTSPAGYFTAEEEKQLAEFCANIQKPDGHDFDSPIAEIPAHLRMFVAVLEALGAVHTTRNGNIRAQNSGRLARHVPEILRIYIDNHYNFIDDWDRSSVLQEDHLSAVSFIHLLEMRRIELSLEHGTDPEPLADRPVAFGIFRARNGRGEDCYLFEDNKDWRKLNFVGGKQEAKDQLDFERTLRREILEETGISPDRVTLTRLNDQPIVGYGLSGNAGSLASYPCVLFGVTIRGSLQPGQHHCWLTEKQIRQEMNKGDGRIMVNPKYMSYLLEGSPSRLSQCPLTTDMIVSATRNIPTPRATSRVANYLRDNQKLIVAVLAILTATITLLVTLRTHW